MTRLRTRYLIVIGDLYLADPTPDDAGMRLTSNIFSALKFVTFDRACHVAKIAATHSSLMPYVVGQEFDY